ncbi:YhdT family protein [Veronia pacifica]|uniref:Sodium:pantothenate symporter n=1 Tax=Veronia pacifica TaxID=1080227 RepID=A0A1C3EC24_9GAMM|nr:YhdT family protein [Veronia pacifica]ODA30792.1 hypothetical protein A8L45_19270 [Veronia pacifica]
MNTLRSRYRQAHKEARWSIGLALAYFVWWYISAYGLPSAGTETEPTLYFGLPLWFLLACVIGPCLFTVLCALMVKVVFKDMPLDVDTSASSDSHEH